MFRQVRIGAQSAPVLVLGQFKDHYLDEYSLRHDADGSIRAASRHDEATGDVARIVEACPSKGFERVLIVGLGEPSSMTPGTLRTVAGALGRRLAAMKATGVEIDLEAPVEQAGIDPARAGEALGEGLGLIAWCFDELRGKATTLPQRTSLRVRVHGRAMERSAREGLELAEGSNLARTLSQQPPNICTPDFMARQARRLARQTGMSCRVLRGAELEREGLVGLINVGKASEHPPCLIRLEYRPARGRGHRGTRADKPLVLVGKTMTYDSGGLSIKVGGSMRGMKRDKDGGCGVLGAMHAIATTIKPRRRVVALLSCAENAISDEAYRPDDVIRFANGVTVEVTNTDAEGRLVLADALCWACKKENPAAIVDVATLTGGVVVALGKAFCGMWCDDDGLRATVEHAAERTGERVWRLPHDTQYREMMRSQVADIVNSAPVREAHPIQGAAFLSYFVDEGIPWCHLDIAGTHAVEKDTGPFVPGPTGFGARLLARVAQEV